jgi:hypothetical protein
MQAMLYQKKVGSYFFPELLVVIVFSAAESL